MCSDLSAWLQIGTSFWKTPQEFSILRPKWSLGIARWRRLRHDDAQLSRYDAGMMPCATGN